MKITIVEPNFHGHHLSYVSHLVAAANAVDATTTVHLSEAAETSDEFRNFLNQESETRFLFDLPKSTFGRFRTYRQTQRAIEIAVQCDRPDILVYPTADFAAVGNGVLRFLGQQALRGVAHSECMLTKIGYAYEGSQSTLLNTIERIGLRASRWDRIGVIDSLAFHYHQDHQIQPERFRLYPDPIEVMASPPSRTEAREYFGLQPTGKWLVCPGIIRRGKGIEELLAAFQIAASKTDAQLALLGPTRQDVRELLQRPQYETLLSKGRIVNIDRVLSEREVGLAILASDLVCCTYPKQNHPSSIAVKSIAYQRPVLCSNNYWIGKMGRDFSMGWVAAELTPNSLGETMVTATEQSGQWSRSAAGDRLVAYQSSSNFRETWKDTFKHAAGSGDPSSALPWSYVADSMVVQS